MLPRQHGQTALKVLPRDVVRGKQTLDDRTQPSDEIRGEAVLENVNDTRGGL